MSEKRNANVSYQGDGIQTKYSFPFDYLRKAFVKVQLIDNDTRQDLTQGTDYTVNNKEITLVSPTEKVINIYRQTAKDPLVSWSDASVLRAEDMTLQEVQLLHLHEETDDKVQENGMARNEDGSWDGRFNKIINVLSPDMDTALNTEVMTVGAFKNAKDSITSKRWAQGLDSPDNQPDSESITGKTQSSKSWSTQAKKWAESDESPDNKEDAESSTGKTQSAKSWVKEAKAVAIGVGNPIKDIEREDTNLKATYTDGSDKKVSLVTLTVQEVIDIMFPVGVVIPFAKDTTPPFTSYGTWGKVGEGRALWGADSSHSAGTIIAAGLPNITGTTMAVPCFSSYVDGAFSFTNISAAGGATGDGWGNHGYAKFDASKSSDIYGNSDTVQPDAYVVTYWQRIA